MLPTVTDRSFLLAEHDYLTDWRAERVQRCACCGVESVDLDDLDRCPSPLCALASRCDAEVPTALLRLTLRASGMAFAARKVARDKALAEIEDEGEADLPALPFERTWTRRDALKAVA